MKSLLTSVLETANLFRKCDKYLQSTILKEECADIPVEELAAEVDKKYNKYHFLKAR